MSRATITKHVINCIFLLHIYNCSVYDHQSSIHEWADYMLQSKRPHLMMSTAGNSHLFGPSHPPLFDYQTGPPSHVETFSGALDKVCNGKAGCAALRGQLARKQKWHYLINVVHQISLTRVSQSRLARSYSCRIVYKGNSSFYSHR